jgi:hypothetical protein
MYGVWGSNSEFWERMRSCGSGGSLRQVRLMFGNELPRPITGNIAMRNLSSRTRQLRGSLYLPMIQLDDIILNANYCTLSPPPPPSHQPHTHTPNHHTPPNQPLHYHLLRQLLNRPTIINPRKLHIRHLLAQHPT